MDVVGRVKFLSWIKCFNNCLGILNVVCVCVRAYKWPLAQ